jgi:hypothetical protein
MVVHFEPFGAEDLQIQNLFRLENSDDDALQQVARQDGGKRPLVPDGKNNDARLTASSDSADGENNAFMSASVRAAPGRR